MTPPALFFFLSILIWLFKVCCGSKQILGWGFLCGFVFWWEMLMEFWSGPHWICRSLWAVWTFSQYPSNPGTWNIFPFLCVFLSLFFIHVLRFSVYSSFTSLVKFTSQYFSFQYHCKWDCFLNFYFRYSAVSIQTRNRFPCVDFISCNFAEFIY